ncbi:MAG: PDZ domain-containing protein [Elusimicrobiota bacterium]
MTGDSRFIACLLAGALALAAVRTEAQWGPGLELAERDGGLAVTRVEPRSPAADAGVSAGDRLLAVTGREVRRLSDLPDLPRDYRLSFRRKDLRYEASFGARLLAVKGFTKGTPPAFPLSELAALYADPATAGPLIGVPLVLERARLGFFLKGKLFIEHVSWDDPEIDFVVSGDGGRSFVLSLRGFRMGGRLLGRFVWPYNRTVAIESVRLFCHVRIVPDEDRGWRVEEEGSHAYIEGFEMEVEDYPAWLERTRPIREVLKGRLEDAFRRKLISALRGRLLRAP